VIVRVTCGDPDDVTTITVADRDVVPVFADTDNVNVPLLEPVAGETLNHVWFDEADHDGSPSPTPKSTCVQQGGMGFLWWQGAARHKHGVLL